MARTVLGDRGPSNGAAAITDENGRTTVPRSKMKSMRYRELRLRSRGFTMVELMVVLTIVGVLAAVGITLLRGRVNGAKASEAGGMIQSIRAAEERWRAETTAYLDVSTSIRSWYPMATPSSIRYHWVQSTGSDFAKWQLLDPVVPNPVQFGYAVKAGPPGVRPPDVDLTSPPTYPIPTYPWYLIQARADVDEDGVPCICAASSFTGEVVCQNEGD
jgi:prepilin-type N-terminal cleavage/methylation domain-containing protein